jgi:hypothetical protein
MLFKAQSKKDKKIRGLIIKNLVLCLAKYAEFRKVLLIKSFAFLAGFARKSCFFYVSQSTQSYAKSCLLDPLRS